MTPLGPITEPPGIPETFLDFFIGVEPIMVEAKLTLDPGRFGFMLFGM
jgi:hypothetical protein